MKIIQITDLHIGMEDEETHDVDIKKNFDTILSEVLKVNPDLIIISGDLCLMQGRKDTYNWIADRLKKVPHPIYFLSGNHDDAPMMAEVFGLEKFLHGREIYGTVNTALGEILLLDTSPATMSGQQKEWLRKELQDSIAPRLVFMHHPPVKAGLPFMDNNHAFKEMDELQQIFAEAPQPISVFCGHYHTECTIQANNLTVYISPSIYFQIDGNFQEFQIDHTRIAYRWIKWDTDGFHKTGVKYFEGHKTNRSN